MTGPDPSLCKAQAEQAELAASQALPLTGASTSHSPRAHLGLSTVGGLASELLALVSVFAWIHVLLPIPECLSMESKLLSLCVTIRQHFWSRQPPCVPTFKPLLPTLPLVYPDNIFLFCSASSVRVFHKHLVFPQPHSSSYIPSCSPEPLFPTHVPLAAFSHMPSILS